MSRSRLTIAVSLRSKESLPPDDTSTGGNQPAKERLVEAARACLREDGFNALSTRKVAERCAKGLGPKGGGALNLA